MELFSANRRKITRSVSGATTTLPTGCAAVIVAADMLAALGRDRLQVRLGVRSRRLTIIGNTIGVTVARAPAQYQMIEECLSGMRPRVVGAGFRRTAGRPGPQQHRPGKRFQIRLCATSGRMRCEPGRLAVRGLRTATGPRSQQPTMARGRRSVPDTSFRFHPLRAGTARGPGPSDRDRSPVAAPTMAREVEVFRTRPSASTRCEPGRLAARRQLVDARCFVSVKRGQCRHVWT